METAALELAAHPNDKLLSKFLDAPGAMQVERRFKLASFLLETTPSPSPGPASRRRRLNMNVTPDKTHQQSNRNGAGNRSRPYEQRQFNGGATRGRYNKNFRPPQRSYPRFSPSLSSTQQHQSPASSNRGVHTFLETTPPSMSGSSVTIRPWSPAKGRVLAWDDI
jgi:hypothetical protein